MATLTQVSTGSGGTWSVDIVGLDTNSTTSSRPTISNTSTLTSNPYLIFNCPIPAGAVVTAISAQVKMSAYSAQRTASVQLYNGTTSISQKLTVSSTSTSNISTIDATSIPTDLTNLRLYFGASSTSSAYRPYVYGAQIIVTYTVLSRGVTIATQGSGSVTQDPSGTSIAQGTDVKFLLTPDAGCELVSLTDNGMDVLSQVYPYSVIAVDRSLADSDFTITQRTSSYGFTKQSDSLTYTSTMSGSTVRAGCTRFTTNFEYSTEITLSMKWNTANASDYVYIGNFDTSLSTSNTQPTSGTYQYSHAGTTTTFTYTMTVPAGSHYFDVYNYHSRSNSSRACTIVFSGTLYKEQTFPGVYVYDILAISSDHTLSAVFSAPYKTCTITYNGSVIASTEESGDINIVYNGSVLASAVTGTKTMNCSGKVMASNVSIGSRTLNCNGNLMASNIIITVT